jgi:hypothetical protein
MVNQVEFMRIANGEFDVIVNGERSAKWGIVNGSGVSGRGRNVYAIVDSRTGGVAFRGSLANCKALLIQKFNK